MFKYSNTNKRYYTLDYFYKKKFGILIDGYYYGRSLEDIMNLLKEDLSITFEEFKEKVKNFI